MKMLGVAMFFVFAVGFILWIFIIRLNLSYREKLIETCMVEKTTLNILPGIALFIMTVISAAAVWG